MKAIIILAAIFNMGFITQQNRTFESKHLRQESFQNNKKYKACIEACNECIAACRSCQDACTSMDNEKMKKSIKHCSDCISICKATAELLRENSEYYK